ncbi:hypothetical protein XENOCAPTIV_004468, partial [Xenoophorus captivus]
LLILVFYDSFAGQTVFGVTFPWSCWDLRRNKSKTLVEERTLLTDVVLRRLPLHVGACDLHGEPVQQVLMLPFICLDRYLPIVRANDSRATRKLLASTVIYIEVWLPVAILTAPDLVFARVQDIQNISSSSYLLAEDAMESAGSIALSAHLPAGKWYDVHGDFPLLAHPDGLRPTQTGHPRLQLYHHLQSLLGCHGPGAEEDKCTEEDGNPRKSFFSCWLPFCLGIFVDTLTMLNIVSSICEVQQAVRCASPSPKRWPTSTAA